MIPPIGIKITQLNQERESQISPKEKFLKSLMCQTGDKDMKEIDNSFTISASSQSFSSLHQPEKCLECHILSQNWKFKDYEFLFSLTFTNSAQLLTLSNPINELFCTKG